MVCIVATVDIKALLLEYATATKAVLEKPEYSDPFGAIRRATATNNSLLMLLNRINGGIIAELKVT